MTDILHADKVTKRFGGLIAVNNVEFTIPEKSIVSLIGPNGAGKTTFFNIIAGIYDPTAGRIEFGGTPMIARPRRAWLEPVLWIVPPVLLALILLVVGQNNPAMDIIGIVAMVATLVVVLLVGVSRPPMYNRLLIRLGDLQERPAERHGRRRARPDVPEHPPLPEHDRPRERPRRDALPAEDVVDRRDPVDPPEPARGADVPGPGARAASPSSV